MKKNLRYIWFYFIIMTSVAQSVFQIAVPKKLVEEKASLVLVMSDEKGELSIGKCRLHQVFERSVIAQKDLEIISSDCAESIRNMELLPDVSPVEQVIVYFELNAQINVIRVMVIKECFLDADPFDVVSFNIADEVEFEGLYSEMNDTEVDSLSALTESLNGSDLSSLSSGNTNHWFEQYLAYAKIFTVMQYNKMEKVVRRASSWWY